MKNKIVKYDSLGKSVYIFVLSMTHNNKIHGLIISSDSDAHTSGTNIILDPSIVEPTNIIFK